MKTRTSRAMFGVTLALMLALTATQMWASAQEQDAQDPEDIELQEEARGHSPRAGRLEGVWNLTVTVRNCQTGAAIRSFPAMHTYMRGGTMSDFGVGSAPLPRSSGQGVWSYQSRDHYSAAFQFFRFNADGTYAGRQINRVQIELSRFDDSYTSSATAQTFDVNGNVIANSCFTATGTRFE